LAGRPMDKRILVIGDDAQTEALLSQAFAGSDFQILIISGNGSAISPSGLIGPDLIIFDSLLPDAPGWHTLRQIRQMSSVPIIVLSEVEDSQVRIKSLDLGADYCLSKPVDLEELQARIGVLLRRAPNAARSAAGLSPT
jgi:two-component system, OmpR family, KDP operon response regulator KdpE